MLTISDTGGYPRLQTPADIFGVRLMWVCGTDDIPTDSTTAANFFGYAGEGYGNAIRKSSNGQATGHRIQSWSNQTGAGLTQNTGLHTLPETGLHLFEVEVATNSMRTFIDGTLVASSTHSHGWSSFLIDRVGRGQADASGFRGLLGDVLGVTLDHPHTEAAIAAARAYLNGRFDLGLVL